MLQADPRWELAKRVAASAGFQKAARLREFLKYVCACTILDRPDEATEQQIGIHVFGRQPAYSPNEDNVVRSQARLLRLRLEHYFAGEGEQEPVIITIPKGHYLPVFESRSVPAALEPVANASSKRPAGPNLPIFVLAGVTVVLAVTSLWLGVRLQASLRVNEVPTEGAFNVFWNEVFQTQKRTDIVVSDHTYGMLQEAAHRSIPLSVYMGVDYGKTAQDIAEQSGLKKLFAEFDSSHLTGLYDVTNVAQMAGLRQYHSALVSIRFARDANIRDLQSVNVVLIGSRHTNPWVDRFGSALNFDFDFDYNDNDNFCVNRKPRAGEQAEYRPTHSGAERVVYGGVALLPGPQHRGNVLILLGTSFAGGETACEFITNEKLCSRFLEKLTAESKGRLPYFEVLLRTVSISGQQATSPEVIGYRVIPN
ncbi:MAG: hypothetical protein P4K98_04410 [Bryobacteraceae bacterium]|nr:hypothetical protein [Bryobacteraceae bacterium]